MEELSALWVDRGDSQSDERNHSESLFGEIFSLESLLVCTSLPKAATATNFNVCRGQASLRVSTCL